MTLREIKKKKHVQFDLPAEEILSINGSADGAPTRAKGLTLLSAPMASSSCCGDRPHSRFLTAQTEAVTAAMLVGDCRGKRGGKKMKRQPSE